MMEVKNKLLCLLGILFMVNHAFGTAQCPDKLIYKGKEMFLLDLPMQKYPGEERLTGALLFGRVNDDLVNSACWRGMVATWEIDRDSLFLTGIENIFCPSPEEILKRAYRKTQVDSFGCRYADLQKVFGSECRNGRVFAYWITDTLLAGMGGVVYYVHSGFLSSWKYERDFVVERGILKDVKEYDNSRSVDKDDQKVIREWGDRYEAIDWTKVQDLGDRRLKTLILFSANEQGIVDSVKIARSCGVQEYDRMALQWPAGKSGLSVNYKRGEFCRNWWYFPFEFSGNMKNKYSRKE